MVGMEKKTVIRIKLKGNSAGQSKKMDAIN